MGTRLIKSLKPGEGRGWTYAIYAVSVILCIPIFFIGGNWKSGLLATVLFVPSGYYAALIADRIRRIIHPNAVITSNVKELINNVVYWRIGPQFSGLVLAAIFSFAIGEALLGDPPPERLAAAERRSEEAKEQAAFLSTMDRYRTLAPLTPEIAHRCIKFQRELPTAETVTRNTTEKTAKYEARLKRLRNDRMALFIKELGGNLFVLVDWRQFGADVETGYDADTEEYKIHVKNVADNVSGLFSTIPEETNSLNVGWGQVEVVEFLGERTSRVQSNNYRGQLEIGFPLKVDVARTLEKSYDNLLNPNCTAVINLIVELSFEERSGLVPKIKGIVVRPADKEIDKDRVGPSLKEPRKDLNLER